MSSVSNEWDDRVADFWAHADDADPEAALAAMSRLVAERPSNAPEALYESASVHDFLGQEAAAIPLYRAALDAGLSGDRAPQAVVQLASSLRNVGDPGAAIDLLEALPPHEIIGCAGQAFLALALHDAGRHDEALRVALSALAPTLPLYGGAVAGYAAALTGEPAATGRPAATDGLAAADAPHLRER